MKLAAVVITLNEERNIERCLKSLHFCDEIIVVDAGSRDRTREIAEAYATQVVVRDWGGYANQKNYANSLTAADWILSLDADEEVSPELREEIKLLMSAAPSADAYSVPRKTIHLGRWIRYGGWYPNRLVRLFNPRRGSWDESEVHESWVTQGRVQELKADLIHHSFADLADQVQRNNLYSTLGAERLRREGRSFSFLKLCCKTMFKFIETYFIKLGFMDGYPGFIISVSAAYSVFLKWAKLWELERSAVQN